MWFLILRLCALALSPSLMLSNRISTKERGSNICGANNSLSSFMRFRYSRLDCSLARLSVCLSFFSLVVFYHHSSTAVAAAGRERERWTTTTTPIRHRIIRAFRV